MTAHAHPMLGVARSTGIHFALISSLTAQLNHCNSRCEVKQLTSKIS